MGGETSFEAVLADLRADFNVNGRSTNALRVMLLYRLGRFFQIRVVNGHSPLISRSALALFARLQKWFVFYPYGIEMPFGAAIGGGLKIPHLNGIVLSSSAVIGAKCVIYHQVTVGVNEHSRRGQGAASIGNRVYIGAGAKIIGPVVISDDAVVGANSVVVRDI